MLVAEVKKLSPLERFIYWCRERHNIYLRRRAGQPKPWTDDEILQSWFFTNPYRENDKVTQWFRDNVRGPMYNDPGVIFATVAFRWFNWIPTGEILLEEGLLEDWDEGKALEILGERRAKGEKLFTGAFMINSPGGIGKLEAICKRIDQVWEDRTTWADWILTTSPSQRTLQDCCTLLQRYDGMGGFMAYEVACDLRYTFVLDQAPDKCTWCNPGPGCVRGLYRLNGWDWENKKASHGYAPPVPKDFLEQMRRLLGICHQRLRGMLPFEMREVEMSLCETDKYERALWNDGDMKRRYDAR